VEAEGLSGAAAAAAARPTAAAGMFMSAPGGRCVNLSKLGLWLTRQETKKRLWGLRKTLV
jgi:hypothetical protein